jgi:Family of unknown function (DUF5755)
MSNYIPIDVPSSMIMVGGAENDNNKTLLYAGLFILVAFVLYNMWKSHSSLASQVQIQQQEISQAQQAQQQAQEEAQKQVSVNVTQPGTTHPPVNPWREYDRRVLRDPLVAPRRRDDYNLPVLPVPTRGYPAPYKKMGLLIDKKAKSNDRYKILLLMGRNQHPRSVFYDYYAAENDPDSAVKFEIDKERELRTDDKVKIPELNRTYTVTLDKMLGYSYDPYIY